MKINQMQKVVAVTVPAAINDNAAYTTIEIDTVDAKLGKADYCSIYVMFGAMDIAVAVLKAQESDTTGTGFVDIAGADFSVLPAVVPSATYDGFIVAIHIDMTKNRKRFIDLSFTAGDGSAGTYAAAWANLTFGSVPCNYTDRGLAQELLI